MKACEAPFPAQFPANRRSRGRRDCRGDRGEDRFPSKPVPDGNKRATRGYQASEHINNYYRTTKV